MGKAVDHSARAHALLSASGASRWLNCTPSPRIEERFEEEKTSTFAAEGTLAHEFGDIGLRRAANQITEEEYIKLLEVNRAHELYTDEMEDEVQKYIDYVMEQYNAAKQTTPDAILSIEEKIDLTDFIEDGFGTNDAVIIADGVMEVNDLKYGKGIRVSAEDNPQLKLYGLGALAANELMYDIKTVRLGVIQPRLDHIDTWEIPAEDLKKWGEYTVRPKAKLAYAGEGLQQAGDWCRWCKAKAKCATLASRCLKIAKHEFKDPHILTDAQLMDVYHQIAKVTDWASAVNKHVLDEAIKGKKWPGLKLVEGRSNRVWANTEKVAEVLIEEGYGDDQIYNTKLKGIGDIEKLVTKAAFPAMLGDVVNKPPGKPSLVPESDKRRALGIAQAKEDFK